VGILPRGDAFLARVFDDGEDFKRMDFGVEEVSSTAQWVLDAKDFNERKRLRESPEAIFQRITADKKTKSEVEELSPAEASREDGNSAFRAGKYREAVDWYTKAIELESAKAVAYSNRAMAYLKLECFAEAESDATEALELDSKNVKAMFRRGCAREAMGLMEQAKEDFKCVLELDDKNSAAKKRLAALQEG